MKSNILLGFFILLFTFSNAPFASADDLALTGSNSFSGVPNIAMPITDLQISGTTPGTTPVKLLVTNGTLAMSTTTGLTFTGPSTGSTLYFSGTLANINAALATLTYTRGSNGSDTLEVSLVNSGEVFFSGNNHLYKFITGSITWNGAQAAAPSQTAYGVNGYLATITSQQENDFVAARLVGDGWFGASDSVAEGNWKWVAGPENGTQFWSGAAGGSTVSGNYANWATGEPNDSSGNEDCAQFYISTGKWNDLPCSGSTLAGYVVEFGTPGNLPTVVAKNISITTASDVTPPTVPGIPTTTTPTNDTTPTWTWATSTDAGSGLERYLLKWSQNTDCSLGFTTTTGPSGTYTIPDGILTEGTWYFCVAARDNAQNDSAYSAAGSVVIDTTAPILTQVTPVSLPVYAGINPIYYFSANDTGTFTISSCGGGSQAVVDSSSAVIISGLSLGQTYSCTLYLTDAAGNQSNTLTIGPFTVIATPTNSVSSGSQASGIVSRNTSINSNSSTLKTTQNLQTDPKKFPFYPTLRYGNKNNSVKALQQFLNAHDAQVSSSGPGSLGQETDLFSQKTLNAVKTYQKLKGISSIDGVVGPITHKVMMTDLGF